MNNGKLTSFLAIDLGASSGRAIFGAIRNGQLEMNEINRFPNPMIDVNSRLYWDLFYLYQQIIESLQIVKSNQTPIASLGIDTWGVDFVCFGKDGEPLRSPYSYRNTNTFGAPERFFAKMPREEVYRRTGIQIMNINTLFQLDTMLEEESSIYPVIDKVLFMPDALSYMLTGQMVTEYTIASTSQLIDPRTRAFDPALLEAVKLTSDHFAPIVFSGTRIGPLSESAKRASGLQEVEVIAVAGHDTGSAVLAVPAESDRFAYLSSGTWSLMGIESEQPVINEETFSLNFTNEGGADGSTRLLKNICGMWLIEQCKKEWENERPITYDEIVNEAQKATPFTSFINPDAACFASPTSMVQAIREYCRKTDQPVPETVGEMARCIYESLAFRYRQVLLNLETLADHPIEKLHIIGGGSKNDMLNAFTANAIGIPVIAGPSEATAMGNILLQAKAAGIITGKEAMRKVVRDSTDLTIFEPTDIGLWSQQYQKYLSVFTDI
ncbi:MAG: rhamnulokinase family protein [Bacteroidota bacterium]|nr:rhamnulokinase family protein [Bacteroidota bacterium]HHU97029.1 rhamnulokinase [Petrimonas sp.]